MLITPDIWGPYGWKFIHFIALGYPTIPTSDIKNKYYNFFMSLPDVLPCSICGNHFKENLINHPLDDVVLSSRDNLINWTIDMHNEVNKSNNKKIYNYDEAKNLILNNYKENNQEFKVSTKNNKQNKYNYFFIILLILLVIYVYYNI
jgi:hypothetical protein